MAKDTYYFSHDCNARNDEKLIAVRMKHGAEGYGIYFMILERLMESTDYMSVKDYNIIAFDLRVDTSKIKSIIEDFGLFVFTEDGKYFYSESFNRRMVPLDNLREQRKLAGKKSAEKRAKKNDNSTTVERPLYENSTKESKGKENNSLSYACEEIPAPDIFDKSLDECYSELKSNQSWAETVTINIRSSGCNDFTLETFYRYLEQFFMEQQNKGETSKSPKDAMSHFASWLKIELKKIKDERKTNKNGTLNSTSSQSTTESSLGQPDWLNKQAGTLEEFINSIPIGR